MRKVGAFAALTLLLLARGAVAQVELGLEAFKVGDYKMALEEFRAAAQQGDVRGTYMLGEMYSAGKGVEKDLKKAAEFYHSAAEQGMPDGALSYAIALVLGDGVDQNLREAYKWLLIAQRGGEKEADRYFRTVAQHISRRDKFEVDLEVRKFMRDLRLKREEERRKAESAASQ